MKTKQSVKCKMLPTPAQYACAQFNRLTNQQVTATAHNKKMRDQFMRIAMAQLRSTYPFKPQRRAVAARMWVKYLERKNG